MVKKEEVPVVVPTETKVIPKKTYWFDNLNIWQRTGVRALTGIISGGVFFVLVGLGSELGRVPGALMAIGGSLTGLVGAIVVGFVLEKLGLYEAIGAKRPQGETQ